MLVQRERAWVGKAASRASKRTNGAVEIAQMAMDCNIYIYKSIECVPTA